MESYTKHLTQEIEKILKLTNEPLDRNSMIISSNLYRASMTMRSKFEKEILSDYKLSFSGFGILYNLWIWESVEIRELAKIMRLTVPTVSSISSTLVKKGLCKRTADTRDRRLVLLSLTEEGLKLIEEAYPKFNKKEIEFSDILSEEEKNTFITILEKIINSN